MAKPADVLNSLKELFEDNKDLTDFVKGGVYLGVRENIVDFPCIVIEYAGAVESDDTYPTQDIIMRAVVMCYFKTFDKDKQIVGDDTDYGLLDFENLVKKAIDGDRYLGGNAEWVSISETEANMDLFPVRNFNLVVNIKYRQTAGTRT